MRIPMFPGRFAVAVALVLFPAAALADRVTVMLELQSPPAVESYLKAVQASGRSRAVALRAATTAARAEIAVVEGEQQSLRAQIAALGPDVQVVYSVQRVFNGVAVDVDASQLDALAKLPGVKRVVPIPLVSFDNTSSVPLIGAPVVWKAAINHATGKGVKVGVIDSGIDYVHRDFAGNADYSGLFDNDVNVRWTAKVAGGTDLAGNNYDASSSNANQRIAVPDPNPFDCAGHGTHVAGTIAGYGVLKNGSTYLGSYDSIDESQFLVGPGVAPQATLYAIKIFGCSGASALVTQALEWALDPNGDGDFSDRMDVVNLSLGSAFGDRTNPDTIAANNLAAAGTVVVASAGNTGDTYYVVGSPGTADRVLSVASSVDALDPADGLRLESPDTVAGIYAAHHSTNFNWLSTSGVSAAVVYPPTQRSGCAVFNDLNASMLRGNIALLDWTDSECTSTERVLAAYTAGALGVIFRYPRAQLDLSIFGSTFIPATIVSSDTGDAILANLNRGVVATLTPDLLGTVGIVTNANIDTLSGFSSRGPRLDDHAIKPEITAPGETIFSARLRSGYRGISMSGTSMAAPHVTGTMALLKELHPTWTVEELKALAMNTATHDLFTAPSRSGPRYSIARIGAGRIDAASAARSTAVALNADHDGLVGVSFGAFEVSTTTSRETDVVVENKGTKAITYDVAYDAVADQPGVVISIPSGPTVTVPAGSSAMLRVRVDADASLMRHRRDASITPMQDGTVRDWLGEESGYLRLSAAGAETLRVPVFAVVRAVSTMEAAESALAGATTMTLHLTGTTIATGSGSLEDENAIVSAFELADENDRTRALSSTPWLDLEYAGIATDVAEIKAAGKKLSDATINFGIATYGNWTSPQQTEIRIDVDTNNDGIDDWRITLSDLGTFNGNAPSDTFAAVVCPERSTTNCHARLVNGVDAGTLDTVPFNTNVIVLPVRAGDLGLGDGFTKFAYRITTGEPPASDQTPRLTYDLAAPGLSFSSPVKLPFGFADRPGNTIAVTYDPDAFHRTVSHGILLLHHHNATGRREEAVFLTNGKHRAAGK